jgi:hypothetical protein
VRRPPSGSTAKRWFSESTRRRSPSGDHESTHAVSTRHIPVPSGVTRTTEPRVAKASLPLYGCAGVAEVALGGSVAATTTATRRAGTGGELRAFCYRTDNRP